MWDFRDAQAVVAVNNDSLTAGNQLAVQKQLNGVVDLTIQLDDRTAGQLEHFTQGQLTLAEAKRDIQLDVHNQLEVDGIDGRVLRVGGILHSRSGRQRLQELNVEIEQHRHA